MRNSESPVGLEWIVISMRWFSLIALILTTAVNRSTSTTVTAVFIGAAVWNVLLTIFATFNRKIWHHRGVSLAVDVIIASLLFYFSGDIRGNLGWAGLLPLFTAAFYFQMRGALWSVLPILFIQGSIALIHNDLFAVAAFLGSLLILYLVVGALLGSLTRRLSLSASQSDRDRLNAKQETERAEQERSKAIYKLISALNASLNYQRVLETALDLGYSTLATQTETETHLVSGVLLYTKTDANGTELRVGAARRFTPADLRISLPGTSGLIGKTIDEGASRLGKGLNKDPELSRMVAVRSCHVAYCIPLSSGLETYGVLLFAHPDENYFTNERREILDIIGSQAVVAMRNARLYRDLELEKERMTEIQEEARKKLARDLHDGPTQSVAALAMRVNFARRLMERNPAAAADELFKVEDLARRTTKEIRHMLFTLRPLVLESQGLVAALESMAEKMQETYSQTVIIEAQPEIVSQLESGKQGVIFYIVEEAVNNARKHAKAEHIWVRLRTAEDNVAVIEIQDDGTGFNVESVDDSYDNRGSLGMVNMRERAELLNGVLQIESSVEKGTLIRLIVPLTESAADRIRRGP
jgi:signal transduction histidine kinase